MTDQPIRRLVRALLPLLGAACALAAAGCRQPSPIPTPDGGSSDANVIVYVDSDGDGLCDDTELARRTDPTRPDTDGDGFSDRVEVDFGYNPTRTDSPDRDIVVRTREAAGATIDVPVAYVARGEGQSFTGAFQAMPVLDAQGVTANDFYARSVAVGADPMHNVFEVVPEEERFDGVDGRTQLVFVVTFESPSTEPRGCRRAYPFRYNVKRSDGTLVFSRRFLLVVEPEGEAGWCPPVGTCI